MVRPCVVLCKEVHGRVLCSALPGLERRPSENSSRGMHKKEEWSSDQSFRCQTDARFPDAENGHPTVLGFLKIRSCQHLSQIQKLEETASGRETSVQKQSCHFSDKITPTCWFARDMCHLCHRIS